MCMLLIILFQFIDLLLIASGLWTPRVSVYTLKCILVVIQAINVIILSRKVNK